MKRIVAVLLIGLVLVATLSATPINYTYTPYEEGEFPLWSMELRRAETIFFGSYVISLPVAAGVVSLLENRTTLVGMDVNKEALVTLAGATGISLFIAGLDWLLGRI